MPGKYFVFLELRTPDSGHPFANTSFSTDCEWSVQIPAFAREEPIPLLGDNSTCLGALKLEITSREDGVLMRICGPVDIDTAPALRDRLLAVLKAPHAKVVSIDLSAVTHMDSSGVATLIEALKIARSYSSEVRLQALQGRLLRLFQATGILSLFNDSTPTHGESHSKAV